MEAPRTSRILPTMEPAIDAFTTSCSPARSAASAMISSAALPKVALRSPPTPSPMRSASCSVAWPIHPARGRMARQEVAKTRRCRSGARYARPTASGTNSRSQFMGLLARSRWAALFPIHPVDVMRLEVAADSRADGREEGAFADLLEQAEPLQLVLYRILEFREAQLDVRFVQGLVELFQHVGRGDVHAGDRLCRNDQPARGRRRILRRVEDALLEQLGIGEEQGRIPAEEDEPGYSAGVGVAGDVVVALDAFGAP